jgi:hypothetical protein
MPHTIEAAASGRAKCRGCDQAIGKGELRFGERLPNAFGEGDMTLWFHLVCAAYKRPESFLETLRGMDATGRSAVERSDELERVAEFGIAHRRLPRVTGADRAPTGRARCRHCKELIAKDTWRIALVFFEEYRFQPSGFVHAACARDYLETTDLVERVHHFAPKLSPADLDDFAAALADS